MAETGPIRPDGRFRPGQTGNAKGRPRVVGHIRDLARKHSKEALARLVSLMRGDNEKMAGFASVALLDRGWGKPSQPLEGADGEALVVQIVKYTEEP